MSANLLVMSMLLTAIPEMNGKVAEVWNSYLAGDFGQVNQQVVILTSSSEINDLDKAILWLTLGCSEAMLGNNEQSAIAFSKSLEHHSELSVTAADLPPPVWSIYREVKSQFKPKLIEALPTVENKNITAKKKLSQPVLNVSKNGEYLLKTSALKSLIFPGWGHLSEGRETGKYIITAEIVLISGYIFAAIQTAEARDEYLKARDHRIIEERYEKYNDLSRLSKSLAIGAVGAYLIAQFDYFGKRDSAFYSLKLNNPYLLSFSISM